MNDLSILLSMLKAKLHNIKCIICKEKMKPKFEFGGTGLIHCGHHYNELRDKNYHHIIYSINNKTCGIQTYLTDTHFKIELIELIRIEHKYLDDWGAESLIFENDAWDIEFSKYPKWFDKIKDRTSISNVIETFDDFVNSYIKVSGLLK